LANIALAAGSAVGVPSRLPGIGGGGAPEMQRPAMARKPPGTLPGGQLPMSADLEAALGEATGATPVRRPARSAGRATVEMRESPIDVNASAESGSGGSVEALNRTRAMAAQGKRYVRVNPGGQAIPTTEDGALRLPRGWKFGVQNADGTIDILNTSND